MKFLTWNVRGCNALDKRRIIKRGFDQAKPEVICIQETKLGSEEAARILGVRQRWSGFFVDAEGASSGLDKCQLWEEISKTLEDIRSAITIVAGDFNATLSHSNKRGGVAAKGGNFTWTNRRLGFSNRAEKLDRFFLTGDQNLVPLIFEAKVLAISGSDHFSVSLVLQKDGVPLRCPFKVEKMWLREQGFRDQIEGKLGALNLKVLAEGMDEVNYLMKKDLLSRYGEVLQRGEIFWRQKSRENWIRAEDRNTKFFHSSVKSGVDQDKLKDEFLVVIPQLVSREDNQMVEKPVSLKELKAVGFGLGGEKVSGSDGFQAFFYHFFWDLLGGELFVMVEESRTRGFILKEFNCTLVALIPKKVKLVGFEEFRPISLCNTIYKIISKIAPNRLKLILEKLISCEQSAFTPRRNIVDGIIVAHEAIHTAMKSRQRRMMLKLAIRKAYDRVDRSFLLAVLAKFGFKVGTQRAIARLFGIRIGQLPGKFLGTLLFVGASKTKIWKGLLDGCKAKMEGWKSKWLTLVGRILILKSVISAMPIFSMACFKLPGTIIKNIQQKMRKFLWNNKQDQDKIPLMAWDRVCKPKGGGGAGLRDWKLINEAMGAKLVWHMYSESKQRWVRILQAKYLANGDRERILTVENPSRGSALWNFLVNCRSLVTNQLTWRIGDDHKASFWQDSWDRCPSLDVGDPQRIVQKTIQHWGDKVSDFLVQDSFDLGQRMTWKDPSDLDLEEVDQRTLRNILASREVMSSREEDEIIWCGAKSGIYSVKLGYALLEANVRRVD
ncbi:uncharacterized protein LOC131856859 [Cryptomeria japonica]|uniref:uncharacterized protein LOC131856859 n=1 Tax=Cryptomeria japonica TaxID=3369 RepID=UPI0027D9FA5A|nr:uncharacterized protein LOC131856859 [Cryptomeria japonica]